MQIKDKVLDVPVIQGGMGVGVSLSSLAGAVAANGACGVISSVNAGYDEQDFKSSPFKANLLRELSRLQQKVQRRDL